MMDNFSLSPFGWPRFIRFICVGALGTAVNVVCLIVLVRLAHWQIDLAYLTALELSVIHNFCLNHWFTFRLAREKASGGMSWRKLLRFNLIAILGAVISWAVFSSAMRGAGLNYVMADLLGIIAATIWNYWLSARLVWPTINRSLSPPNQQYELRKG